MTINTFTFYLLSATVIAYFCLGLWVFLNNPGFTVNRLMLSLSVIAGLWSFSILMVTLQDSYDPVLFWVRASHALGILLPWHIYALAMNLPRGNFLRNRSVATILFLSLTFSILSMTPYMITGIREPLVHRELQFGFLAAPFFLFYSGTFCYVLYHLFRKLLNSHGLIRIQLNYFVWGTMTTFVLSSLANVFLPLLGVIYIAQVDVRNLGPAFSLIMIGSVSYAIVKHRFMDMRFALRKNITITITAFILAIIAILLVRVLFRWNMVKDPLAAEILVATIVFFVVLGLPAIKGFIQDFFNLIIFRKSEDYYSYLLARTRNLQNVLDIDKLLETLVNDIVSSMKLEHGFYCLLKQEAGLKQWFHCPLPGSGSALFRDSKPGRVGGDGGDDCRVEDNPLHESSKPLKQVIGFIEKEKNILLRSDLIRKKNLESIDLLDKSMNELDLEIGIPLMINSDLEGILFLGAKLSGEPYYREEINLFTMISSQVTATLINAKLYQEILDIKQYQEKILANMGNGLIAIDQGRKITVFNSEAEKYTGTTSEMALGHRADDVLDPVLFDLFLQTLGKREGQSDLEIEIQAGRNKLCLSCSTSLVRLSETGSLEVIMVLSNITQIKELEKERSRSQRMVSLGEMAAGIAHEIKNPLVSIKTFADLLPGKYNDDHFRHNFSRVVGQEIVRITRLVDEMLDFAKKRDLFLEAVHLPSLLNEVLLLLSPQLDQHNILLDLEYHDIMDQVKLDRSLIKQAVLNICVNAVHAMPGGGRLKVGLLSSGRVDNGRDHRDQGPFDKAGLEGAIIFIEDTGAGIPEEIRDKIFDPFVTGKENGVGLGLSICHNIVLSHQGQLKCVSSEGKGTRFEIHLPLTQDG